MPEARRRLVRLTAALATLLAAGCAGIPRSGEVQVGREISAGGGLDDLDIRVLPPAPLPGMSPSDVVHGFLRAMVNADGSYEIARAYLTSRTALTWSPADVTIYDDSGVRLTADGSGDAHRRVQFAAPRLGTVDDRGDFMPRAGTVSASFDLARQNGEWRIDGLRNGVLLSAADAPRSYRVADVFYLTPDDDTLVPEQVLLRPDARGVATALVRALLGGPGQWLRPAVRTAFPAHTELLGNVPVDAAGIAEVNLTAAVRQATHSQFAALSAQLAWTLQQVSGVKAVRVLAAGSALTVVDVPAERPTSALASFAPEAAPELLAAVYARRHGWRAVGQSMHGLHAVARLSDLAVSHDGQCEPGKASDSPRGSR